MTGKQDYYRSGTIRERAQELNDLIHNDQIDIIMAVIGGNNTNSILPYLDYEYLNHHPKKFIGYSDTTALLMAIYEKTNSKVYYGPALVAGFGEFPPFVDESYAYFEKVINAIGEVQLTMPKYWSDEQINWEEKQHDKHKTPNQWNWIGKSELKGRIIGGNLNTMVGGIWGSEYMPKIGSGDILLIEDAEKDAATVERNFSHFKVNGVFDKVGGIILGKHAVFDDLGSKRKPIDILLEVLGDTKVPIIYDFDSCHTVPMITTPIGSQVDIDAKLGTVKFD